MLAASTRLISKPCQVAAVCYRRVATARIEFLQVKTDRGKWTFPKGCMEPNLSHSRAAAQEALEEAGAIGTVGKKHFHVYVHAKGVFWREAGVREVAVKAFLLEVQRLQKPEEPARTPTWFTPEAAKEMLACRREAK